MKQSNRITTRNCLQYHQKPFHTQRGKNIKLLLLLLVLLTLHASDEHHLLSRLIQPSNALVGHYPYQTFKVQPQIHKFYYFQLDRVYGKVLVEHQTMAQHSLRHRFPHNKIKLKGIDDDDNDDDDEKDNLLDGSTSNKESQVVSGNNIGYTNIEKNLIVKQSKQLQRENEQLKLTIQKLQTENHKLHQRVATITNTTTTSNGTGNTSGSPSKQKQGKQYQTLIPPPQQPQPPIIVLERFEGESNTFTSFHSGHTGTKANKELDKNSNHQVNKNDIENGSYNSNETSAIEMWCDNTTGTANGDVCPVEPEIQFAEALRDRAVWLVSLLILQSISGIILLKNEIVLSNHPSIIYFLTMLVGAGGNAGNQASVRVIRGIAIGALHPSNHIAQLQFLYRELKMAFGLSIIVSIVGFLRTVLFYSKTPLSEAIAITVALCMIVFTSICFGAILPFILQRLQIDPAHSSTSIQVIMDILGVYLTVAVTSILLDSPIGKAMIANFT